MGLMVEAEFVGLAFHNLISLGKQLVKDRCEWE